MSTSILGVEHDLGRRIDELPTAVSGLPAQRSPLRDTAPVVNSMSNSLRTATVLLVDPDRATRDSLQAGLTEIGIGRVIPTTSLAGVEELTERGVVGEAVGARSGLVLQVSAVVGAHGHRSVTT